MFIFYLKVCGLELSGLLGSLSSGAISDSLDITTTAQRGMWACAFRLHACVHQMPQCEVSSSPQARCLRGAANAGAPLAKLVQTFGWNATLMALIGACGIILLLMAPMMHLDNFSQRRQRWS
ncbi:hypothetical protein WJX75_008056 [Coccomyxa subellipsoidea]|uniref:Uncharacterized protein n=1 Tax=Coccomyxa subellipsoidea TaxID=248742 RepID=A0ABR2YWE5_9CHLO